MGHVAVFACWLLAGTFAVSALGKVRSTSTFADFANSLVALGWVRRGWARPLAVAVVVVEGAVVVLCAVPGSPTAVPGLLLGAGVLVVFAGAAGLTARAGRVVPCRCFGPRGAPLGRRHVLRNAVLAAVALLGLLGAGSVGVTSGPGPLLLTALLAAAGVAVVVLLDDLVDLFRLPVPHPAER